MLHTEHQKSLLKTGLTPQQTHEMRLWLLSKGTDGKPHTSVLYSWYNPDNLKHNGHNAFLMFSQTPLYKKWIGESESGFIRAYADRIKKHIPKRTKQLVELGPGNNKIQTYMNLLCSYEDKKRFQYRPADVAKSGLDHGLADAEKAGFRKGPPILGDWDDPVTFSQVQDAFYVCFGGGFVNSYDSIPERIAHMQGSGYVHRSRVFSNFFAMPGDENLSDNEKILLLKAIYGDGGSDINPNPFSELESIEKARDMVLQAYEALGIDTSKLEFGVEREEGNPNTIIMGARVIAPFTEKEGDKVYTYIPGEFIPLIYSPRPSDEQYTKQIEKGGGKVRDIFSKNGIVGTVIDLPRKQFTEKTKKRAKNIFLTISGAIALTWGMHEYGKYSKLTDAREYALQEMSFKNIEYPLYTKYNLDIGAFAYGAKTNDNAYYETRLERLNYITEQVYDIIHTEYKDYAFPDDNILKAAIMRFVPDNLDYFTTSKGPDEQFFAFVNNVFMPYLFASFGNEKNIGLYKRTSDEEYIPLIDAARIVSDSVHIKEFKNNLLATRTGTEDKILRKNHRYSLYEVTSIGDIFLPNSNGILEKVHIGYITLHTRTGPSYNTKKGESFLIAGNKENGFSTKKAREVIEYMDEKGYASQLTNNILDILDPLHNASNHGVVKQETHEYFLHMNRKGYDFSWLCRGNKQDEMRRFLGGFLLHTGTQLDEHIHCLLDETGVKDIFNLGLSAQVDQMVEFLEKYYGHHNTGLLNNKEKDFVGVRNFLIQVVSSGYLEHINSFYSRHDEPLLKNNIIRTLRRLSKKLELYGFDVEENKNAVSVLHDFYKNYDKYKNISPTGMPRQYSSLDELYEGSILFTSDGRGFMVSGGYHPIAGFELTEKNSYEKMKVVLNELIQSYSNEMFSSKYEELPVSHQRIILNRSLHEIQHTYLNPTYEAAYELAKLLHHY